MSDALAVLNAGYKRGATVDRCKENGDLETFDCYCAKAYAGLDSRSLVATLLSRSITIRLERKAPGERVELWIAELAEPDAQPLRARCQAWAQQHLDALRAARPPLPAGLANRAAEVWWALLAIADQAGGDWPARARQAAAHLRAGGDEHDDQAESTMLLTDIREAFDGGHVLPTEMLLARLNTLDERPWGARSRGEGLDARGLSRLLRPFGIRPRTVRHGGSTPKGYLLDQFDDAFARHLSSPPQPPHPPPPAPHAQRDVADVAGVAVPAPGWADVALAIPEQEALFHRHRKGAAG